MSSPPGSPAIKAEPQDSTDAVLPFNTGEIIEISDDEDEVVAPANTRHLGSPFHGESHESNSHAAEAINLGPSIMSTKPKATEMSAKEAFAPIRARMAAESRELANKQRVTRPPVQRTPRVGRSEMFVTDSHPGTPDPAETFRMLQREFMKKQQNQTLTWQEEIEFERAQAAEKARINKERLDQAYDGSDDVVSVEEDPRMSPSVASLPDEDDDPQPKKRGRKRKVDAISKPAPKRCRAAPKSTEDILVTARRKMEAKAKAKAASKGKKQAPKKQGRKTKPNAPDLLNTAGMLGTNVFEDTARMRDVPDQPTFEADSRKDQALRSLIASVPEEYRHVAKTDKKFLEDGMVISSFPSRSC
jgi:hypothetical protein